MPITIISGDPTGASKFTKLSLPHYRLVYPKKYNKWFFGLSKWVTVEQTNSVLNQLLYDQVLR